jgi:hypothetical protein
MAGMVTHRRSSRVNCANELIIELDAVTRRVAGSLWTSAEAEAIEHELQSLAESLRAGYSKKEPTEHAAQRLWPKTKANLMRKLDNL